MSESKHERLSIAASRLLGGSEAYRRASFMAYRAGQFEFERKLTRISHAHSDACGLALDWMSFAAEYEPEQAA